MSLSTRLDKLEAAMRGRDGGDPPDIPWICRLIYDPSEWEMEEGGAISRKKTEEPPITSRPLGTSHKHRSKRLRILGIGTSLPSLPSMK